MLLLLNGELSDEETMLIEGHLKICLECTSVYVKLKSTMSVIDEEKKLESTPYLFSKIQIKLENQKDLNLRLSKGHIFNSVLKPVYISLLLIFAVGIGMLVGNNLNIYSKSSKSSTLYAVNSTKDFYIYGVDDESK